MFFLSSWFDFPRLDLIDRHNYRLEKISEQWFIIYASSIFWGLNRLKFLDPKNYMLLDKGELMNRSRSFWVAVTLILLTLILAVSAYFRWINFGSVYGPYRVNHWFSWLGVTYIGVVTPAIHIMKKRDPKRIRSLLNIHCLGNLVAFMVISIHFGHQLGRPQQFYPDLGTGIVLYVGVLLNVFTGFFQRFQIFKEEYKTWKFIHLGVTLSFYLTIIIHILHGVGVI
jgi:hypothetical protein